MNRNMGLAGVMVALVALLYATVAQLLPVVTEAPVAPLAATDRVKGEELDPTALKRLAESLRVALGEQATASSIALAPFGYVPPAPSAPVVRRAAPLMPLELSLVYESGDRRYARINGKLYQQGQVLPSGETLIQVTTDRIVVGRQDATRQVATRQVAMDVSRLYRQPERGSNHAPGLPSPVLFRLPVGQEAPVKPAPDVTPRRDFAGEGSLDILVSRDPN